MIHFVILTWNSQQYIERCLDSILSLHNDQYKIWIIDNGSTDNTRSILARYQADARIQLTLFPENRGTTVSRNYALRQIKTCDYVCILDSDAFITQEALALMTAYMENHPSCGLAGPRLLSPDGTVQMNARRFPTLWNKALKAIPNKSVQRYCERNDQMTDANDLRPQSTDYLLSACWLLRFSILPQTGLFDESIFYAPEDAEFCIRVWEAGYEVTYLPETSVVHCWQRISRQRVFSKHNMEHIKGLLYMFKKHKSFLSEKNAKRHHRRPHSRPFNGQRKS